MTTESAGTPGTPGTPGTSGKPESAEPHVLVLGRDQQVVDDVCTKLRETRSDVSIKQGHTPTTLADNHPHQTVVVCLADPGDAEALGFETVVQNAGNRRVIVIGFDGVELPGQPSAFASVRACASARRQGIEATVAMAASTLPAPQEPKRFHDTVCAIRDLVREWNHRLDSQQAA